MVNDLKERVLGVIESGAVTRRLSVYFFARLLVTILATGLVLMIALYLVSLALFVSVHETIAPPPRGFGHIVDTLLSLPWLLFALIVLLVGMLEWLSREFAFVYQRPIIYTFFVAVVAVTALGSLLIRTEMHERALEMSRERRLPVMGPVYRYYLHAGEEIDEMLGKKQERGPRKDN